ncbi:MAG: hypothetical protein GAK31_01654 [Stenotrophomonas maltophilia]|uniref:Uncharacterized protein n=1 Tax=Stenotrophomonas maltophilia TaxID=40324 RepID=A0A7V8JML9_STEMA|nr:MAG: hypothetical protein GAK31_01654 [Stenotrophomonas maltophilia]
MFLMSSVHIHGESVLNASLDRSAYFRPQTVGLLDCPWCNPQDEPVSRLTWD